ncbi:MAG: ABC transporter substrate-binding protein [Solirubrobacteraceae bacterium]
MSIANRRVVVPVAALATSAAVALSAAGAASAKVNWSKVTSAQAGGGMAALVKAAKAEKSLNVIALPPTWANYGKEINTFEHKYGIKIYSYNPNGTSAQEIEAITQDRGRSSAPDVVDVGESFSVDSQDFAPYKVQTWNNIPKAAKNPKGLWYNDYGGYMSFGCDMAVLHTCPTTWLALTKPQYKNDVTLNGAIGQAAAATDAVYAAALNVGGSLKNVKPGIRFFQTLKADGNFNSTDCNSPSIIEANECPILMNWDYLNTAKSYGLPSSFAAHWKIVDPKGKVFAGYYVQAVSKYAPHPAAARLWEEFLYSTQGQNIWLEGGARPIELPALVAAKKENKKAYKALPPVIGTPVLPTVAQTTAATTAISAAFSA